jgi:hypothetical protein
VLAAKIRDLVLPHSVSNHLFREVLHHLACWGYRTCSKVVNLLDKKTLLFIRKVLVDLGLKVSSRASLAFPATYNGCMDKIVVFSNLAIISNALRIDCGQRGLHSFLVDHFVVV